MRWTTRQQVQLWRDGVRLSSHLTKEGAYEAAAQRGPGTYLVQGEITEVVVPRRSAPAPAPPPAPAPAPAPAPSPAPVLKYRAFFDSEAARFAASLDADAASGNCELYYSLMYAHDAYLSMYEATRDVRYLERSLAWAETQIARATIIDRAGYRNWAPGASPDTRWASVAVPSFLYDGQATTELARLSRMVLTDPALRSTYGTRAQAVRDFVRVQQVQKWVDRFPGGEVFSNLVWDANPLRNTGPIQDKGVIWSRTFLDLDAVSPEPQLRQWAVDIFTGLRDRLVPYSPPGAAGTLDIDRAHDYDTSHANRFAYAAIDGLRKSVAFTSAHVAGLGKLLGSVMWNRSTADPRIATFISGAGASGQNGNIWFGFAHLGAFDESAQAAGEALLDAVIAGRTNPTIAAMNNAYGRLGLAAALTRNHVLRVW